MSSHQQGILGDLTAELANVEGVEAVVLGGSRARSYATSDSDLDIGVFYSEERPFLIADIRGLANRINDEPRPAVSDFYGWGPWVNGGAWLTVHGQRMDFLYRNLQHVERTIRAAKEGHYELDYDQQPPFGFFSVTYLGEIEACIPLFDPHDLIGPLKNRVADYPEALRRAVVFDYLRRVEFGINAFARKLAGRGNVYGTVGCLARLSNQLTLVLFALNDTYLVNDKTALVEIAKFPLAPADFASRINRLLSNPGRTPEQLTVSVEGLSELFSEITTLADDELST